MQPEQNASGPVVVQKTNALCLTSFILSIVCFLTGWLFLPLIGTVLALILGIVGISTVKTSGEGGRLLGIWGIVISCLTLAIAVVQILFLMFFASDSLKEIKQEFKAEYEKQQRIIEEQKARNIQ